MGRPPFAGGSPAGASRGGRPDQLTGYARPVPGMIRRAVPSWPSGRGGAAGALAKFVYGNIPMDELLPKGAGELDEPWASFERARRLARARKRDQAAQVWRQIADADGLESRHTLQALPL